MDLELKRTPPPRERADAARNRARVLAAAAKLFAEKGVEAVSMDAVAAEAGVGKGTLFRRFGDKAGLAGALLDEREREVQAAILSGPAPLGPGAGPAARLHAFADAYLDYALAHLPLVRMSENAAPGARYRIGAYHFWHRHVTILVAELARDADRGGTAADRGDTAADRANAAADRGDTEADRANAAADRGDAAADRADPAAVAHALLAPLGGEHLTAMVDEIGAARARRSVHALIDALA